MSFHLLIKINVNFRQVNQLTNVNDLTQSHCLTEVLASSKLKTHFWVNMLKIDLFFFDQLSITGIFRVFILKVLYILSRYCMTQSEMPENIYIRYVTSFHKGKFFGYLTIEVLNGMFRSLGQCTNVQLLYFVVSVII